MSFKVDMSYSYCLPKIDRQKTDFYVKFESQHILTQATEYKK